WQNPGAVGCPLTLCPGGSCGTGDSVDVVLASSSFDEGTTAHSMTYLLVSFGYSFDFDAYVPEAAHPAVLHGPCAALSDCASGDICLGTPARCARFQALDAHVRAAPTVSSVDAATGAVSLAWDDAVTDDDCGPAVLGTWTRTCTDYPGS